MGIAFSKPSRSGRLVTESWSPKCLLTPAALIARPEKVRSRETSRLTPLMVSNSV